jgi:HAD superfamily hydrolase (TIGR01509 family)
MIQVIAFDLNGVLFPTPRKINNKVMNFVKECKELGYRLIIASNASKSSFEWRNAKYNLMDVFDGRIISSDIGTRKPSKKFFRYLIKIVGFAPSEILLVDDREWNIRSATDLGLECIKYENEESVDKIREFLKNDRQKKSAGTD